MSDKDIKVGSIVLVHPASWREQNPFRGKVVEITQSGAYIVRPYGKKRWSATSVYFGDDEIEYYPHAFGCEKFDDGKCNCGYAE